MHIYGKKVKIYAYMSIQYRYIGIFYIYIIHICMHTYMSSSVIFFQISEEVRGFLRSSGFCSLKFFAGLIFVDFSFNIFKYLGL